MKNTNHKKQKQQNNHVMRLWQSFVIACSMYSRIPMPRVDWNKDNMKYALCFFPMIGVVIGGAMYVLSLVFQVWECGSLFRSVCYTLLPIGITGGIHMDGFMDTVDALSSYGDVEKKLQILKDSHAGAFAILGLGCYLLWSVAVWSEVRPEMVASICCIFVLSRSFSGWSVVTFPAAKDSGLARTFQDYAHKHCVATVMKVWMAGVILLAIYVNLIYAIAVIVANVAVFLYYKRMCSKTFGGITGDLAGYYLQITELAMITSVVWIGNLC